MFSISDARVVTDPVLREQIERHPRAQELLRAFLYPYAAPDHDFLFEGGITRPLTGNEVSAQISGRIPVLAVGSNRAPVQLARKFTHQNLSDVIPVTLGWMKHHDIVYSTHITGYGAIPATLAPSPGTCVRIAVTWLTPAQLSHMHLTESVPAHYQYLQLHGRDIDLDCGSGPEHVGIYQSSSGYLFGDGRVFALSSIRATGRRYRASSQWEMMEHAAQCAGQVLRAEFVLRLIDDPRFRTDIRDRFIPKQSSLCNPH
ncbi:hypothetical protein [Thalassospira profundimaris]|uniref:hypothetical protein n=1 Tax=Thalassospira profundimaris TaxID=502049 RepID=UPI000DEDAE2C|nr:hypothetical protein [Thalassospira profundimaris]